LRKVLHDAVGIDKGFMTTIRAYRATSRRDTMHKDLVPGGAARHVNDPTSTGAAKAIGLVIRTPGRLDGTSIRVPVPNVSWCDF
jgi:glyceraldehyde 3-phosphate dehydrogenase